MGISRQQALECFQSDDLIAIGMEADAVRRRLHPESVVTYSCVTVLDADAAASRGSLVEAAFTGATVRLTSDSRGLESLVEGCRVLRQLFSSVWIEASIRGSLLVGIDADVAVALLVEAGATAIFVDPRGEPRDYDAIKAAALAVHRTAYTRDIRTIATIPFGCGESLEERLDFLEAIRRLQDQTGGFVACLPLGLDAPGGRELDGVTAVERLKMMAITRMYLDNIPHLRSIQTGAGLKVLQTALRFGADDAELRLPLSGATEQDLRRIIRGAGFQPVERDQNYSMMFLN